MNKGAKIFVVIIIGILLLGVSAVIKSQSGTNLVWLVAVILIALYNIIPSPKN